MPIPLHSTLGLILGAAVAAVGVAFSTPAFLAAISRQRSRHSAAAGSLWTLTLQQRATVSLSGTP